MAAPPNKSSSSSLMSNRPNSNSRNSEINNPIRRSFSGNPFSKPSIVANPRGGFNPNTPANSPSDFPRRNSFSRETIVSFRDHEDKENTKDQNPKVGRVRSPAASKGTKNFMSPTISAASKFTPSPRKKILVERNEPARTSLSFSNEKSPFRSVSFSDVVEEIDSNADIGLKEKKIEAFNDKEAGFRASSSSETLKCEEVLDSVTPLSSKNDSKSLSEAVNEEEPDCVNLDPTFKISPTFSCSWSSPMLAPLDADPSRQDCVNEEPDCVNLDPTFKISPTSSCSWSCPMLAPLDADPSKAPYDPKTNYLSPRPQFLHYKPNPRIEVYLNKKSDGRKLEESFISGSFSDSQVTDETQSEHSQKECEDVSSGETVKEEEQQQQQVHVSEPCTPMPKETIEAKGASKPHFFTRSKFIALLLVLSVACVSMSVTHAPDIDPSVLKELSFFKIYDPSEVAEFTKANFDGFTRNIKLLISSSRGVPILGPLHYCNLTTLPEDKPVDGYLIFDHSQKGIGESFEQNVLGAMREREVELEQLEEEEEEDIEEGSEGFDDLDYEEEVQAIDSIGEVVEENSSSDSEEVHKAIDAVAVEPDYEEVQAIDSIGEVAEEISSSESEKVHQAIQAVAVEVQPVLVSQADEIEIEPEVSEAKELQSESEINSVAEKEFAEVDVNPESSELSAAVENVRSSEVTFSRGNVLGIALLVLTLIAATVFISVRKQNNITPNTAIRLEQPLFTKKLDFSPMSDSTEKHTFQERTSSRNWPTEVDMVDESCPSEMSSFQSSPSYRKKGLKGPNEAQSQERKPRKNSKRESFASSGSEYSMGSVSYGSFTTYEKIPTKHGYGDEETITPVRRSSRIRHQVTSP